jgi:putative two-component system response regulator
MPIELESYLMLADAVIVTDDNHIIVDVNKQHETTTGYSRESIIGLKAGVLKSGLTPNSTYSSLKKELHDGNAWSGVFMVLVQKIYKIWVLV